eukprot:10022961-Lingulodinium_polyedra.AAC.1
MASGMKVCCWSWRGHGMLQLLVLSLYGDSGDVSCLLRGRRKYYQHSVPILLITYNSAGVACSCSAAASVSCVTLVLLVSPVNAEPMT